MNNWSDQNNLNNRNNPNAPDYWEHVAGDLDDTGDIDDVDMLGGLPAALFPEPWDETHDIEYWIWNGERLAPASSAERDNLRERERMESARRRLAVWDSDQRQRDKHAQRVQHIVKFRHACVRLWHSWRHLVRHGAHGAHGATAPLDAHQAALSSHQHDGDK